MNNKPDLAIISYALSIYECECRVDNEPIEPPTKLKVAAMAA
jgi:hypothetical protein